MSDSIIQFIDELSYTTDYLLYNHLAFKFLDSLEEDEKKKFMIKGVKHIKLNTSSWAQDIIHHMTFDKKLNHTTLHVIDSDFHPFDFNDVEKNMKTICNIKEIEIYTENTKQYNLETGGNVICLPNKINMIQFITMKERKQIDEHYEHTLYLKNYYPFLLTEETYGNVYHIDNVMCLIPNSLDMSNNDYRILFYKPQFTQQVPEKLKDKMTSIWNDNYKQLQANFPSHKIDCIDTEFNEYGNLTKPSVFNRLIIKRKDHYILFIPCQGEENNKNFVENYINTQIIKVHFVNTEMLNKEFGNLHCAFQVVSTPNKR